MSDPTPEQARQYIKIFSDHVMPGTTFVEFGNGDKIEFESMSDDQAVRVARGLMEIELEAASRRRGSPS